VIGDVLVLVHQHIAYHPQAWPVLATWHPALHCGPEHARQAALRLVQQLPAGAAVVVLGVGLEATHHHGQPVLRLMDVLGIRPAEQTMPKPPRSEHLFSTQEDTVYV
jgi:hypothetical protein